MYPYKTEMLSTTGLVGLFITCSGGRGKFSLKVKPTIVIFKTPMSKKSVMFAQSRHRLSLSPVIFHIDTIIKK